MASPGYPLSVASIAGMTLTRANKAAFHLGQLMDALREDLARAQQ
jgi:hypothetical protein